MGQIKVDVFHAHLNSHPNEQRLLPPFLSAFDITYATSTRLLGSDLSFYFLSPESHFTEAYGISQEILLLYSAHSTLQPRTLQAAETFMRQWPAQGRVDTLLFFLVTEMQTGDDWVVDHVSRNPETRIIVPFVADALRSTAKADPWYVRNIVSKFLFNRDLFDFRLPLERDTYFFGRDNLLLDFVDAARRGENRGLFGLRKTGKTSFLFKLKRMIQDQRIGTTLYYDCKNPSVRQLGWHELLTTVAEDIAQHHKLKFKKPSDSRLISKAFDDLLRSSKKDSRIVLIFDEIEYISPLAKLDAHWKSEFIPFWQTIWSAQSSRRNISVILAGVNASVSEVDIVNDVQNPLFGIVSHRYLRGLELEPFKRMVKVLGRRMGLRFSDDAISYLHGRYAGHPMLSRLACSLIHRDTRDRGIVRPAPIGRAPLVLDEPRRDAEISSYCGHVISELREFYATEYQLLEMISIGDRAGYLEFSVFPEYTLHLREYGLVSEDDNGIPSISIPAVANYIAIDKARKEGRRTILRVIDPTDRISWINRRKEEIIEGFRSLDRLAKRLQLPVLFGPNSFPEADRFVKASVVSGREEFVAFILCVFRCFVESIDRFGLSKSDGKYFDGAIRNAFPELHSALRRIRLYRHMEGHLELYPKVETELSHFLRQDLEGRNPGTIDDKWFVLQQCTLDSLFQGLQIEIVRVGR